MLDESTAVELDLVLRICGMHLQVLQLRNTDRGNRILVVNLNSVRSVSRKRKQDDEQKRYANLQLVPFGLVVHHLLQSEAHAEIYPELKATLLSEVILNLDDLQM